MAKTHVVGRYAPSPTGDLHLGNLRTALLSWLQVRFLQGSYILRIEDLDTPRVVAGSADQILRDLEWLGLDWDGDVVFQSQRQTLYKDALDQLARQHLIYPCFCSRKDIQQAQSAPHGSGAVYPNICRNLSDQERQSKMEDKAPAYRIKVTPFANDFVDVVAGLQNYDLLSQTGDFVVKRADTLFAYQLAVVVDDAEQKVTHVLRGADLLDSTPRQLYLFHKLKRMQPTYAHVALMRDSVGQRLSKRDGSKSIRQWKKSPEELVGLLAFSAGLMKRQKAMSVSELFAELDYDSFILSLQNGFHGHH